MEQHLFYFFSHLKSYSFPCYFICDGLSYSVRADGLAARDIHLVTALMKFVPDLWIRLVLDRLCFIIGLGSDGLDS